MEDSRGIAETATAAASHAAAPTGFSTAGGVLAAIAAHQDLLIIDLDETLYLRNSTEDFLDAAVPGVVALVLLRMLDLLRPWRFSGNDTRDVWRVGAILLLMPWTLWLWRRRVREAAARHANAPLRDAIAGVQSRTVVATVGFAPIVRPLIAALGLADVRIVAARPWRFADRRRGKLAMVEEAVGRAKLAGALVLTDSPNDQTLLDACRVPLLVRWPDARFVPALRRVYLPGQYLSLVKRPGDHYLRRMILPEDFAFWVLASAFIATDLATHLIGLGFLLVSFWAIYEQGYVDNDLMAARYEADPRLSEAFREHTVATPTVMPWLWAIGTGALGLLALAWPSLPSPTSLAAWFGTLVALALVYRAYNRIDKSSRIWLFSVLHLARVGAFAVVVPVTLAGAAALFANVAARWLPYFYYRQAAAGDGAWQQIPLKLLRLEFYAFAVLPLLAVPGAPSVLRDPSFYALLAWTLLRARSEIAAAWRRVQRIDR